MKQADYKKAIRQRYPEPVSLAVSWDEKNSRANIITLGWAMCTSFDPPMLAISVGNTRYSHETISRGGEFVLVFPSEGQDKASLFCGTHSGSDCDKFRGAGLEALPATTVKPPLIAGARACFECRVVDTFRTGDHTIFVGEVLASHMDETAGPRLQAIRSMVLKAIGTE